MPASRCLLITQRPHEFRDLEHIASVFPKLPDQIEKTWELAAIDQQHPDSAKILQILQIKSQENKTENKIKLDSFLFETSEQLEKELQIRIEGLQWKKQSDVLHKLLSERRAELLKLEKELLQKLEKKNKTTHENRKKNSLTTQRQELLKKCLITLQEADSTQRVEEQFLRILSTPFELSWIKILPQPDDEKFCADLAERIPSTFLRLPLFGGPTEFGSIIFVKIAKLDFSKEQVDFLRQISEAASMAVVRLKHLENTLQLQHQWEATFHALPSPVLLISPEYDIIQSNLSQEKVEKKKCYAELFQQTKPCKGCQRGKKFLLDEKEQSFEVMSQEFIADDSGQKVFVNTYIDISEKSRVQKKILESSKLAEIGLIGGSIAHEINNPLGGLLSYIQLIRMDLAADDPRMKDIQEMETATQRCVQIVKSLLEASRDPSPV